MEMFGLQKSYCWRSVDRLDHCCCDSSQVGGDFVLDGFSDVDARFLQHHSAVARDNRGMK
jgi:hypothetical protein